MPRSKKRSVKQRAKSASSSAKTGARKKAATTGRRQSTKPTGESKTTARSNPKSRAGQRATSQPARKQEWVAIANAGTGGQVLVVAVPASDAARQRDLTEASYAVKVLRDNKQLSRSRGPLKPGETHALEKTESGEHRVVRKRFSAI